MRDTDGWFTNGWSFMHPVHDTFFIGRLSCDGTFHASRVFVDQSQEGGLVCHTLGSEYVTLEAAKNAVAARIAELDAAMPVAQSEQLEACR